MARKSKQRRQPSRRQARREHAKQQQQRQQRRRQLLLGGAVLVLVVGIGLFVRHRLQSQIVPNLQGATENHYTIGPAGAAVVVKEFSDYT